MPFDPRLIQDSFALVEDRADQVAGHFYALLFLADPALRDMFPPMMDAQRDRMMSALIRAAHQVHEPQNVVEYLRRLGREHRKYGVRPEHYDTLSRCFISAMKRFAGPRWTAPMEEAWWSALAFVARTMIAAAREAAESTPDCWTGRVVAHQRAGDALALLTVETDHPYPYRPGQAAMIETLRWPRVWRPYSIANAPRPDGLLTFQVRAVDGGWVSSALVHHTQPGDTVRLGPAVGDLLCGSVSNRNVLLVGGGTGIAPILAIVEDMTRWNTNRQVTVYYGGRRAADLYALGALEALRVHAPWLTIVPCVSHDAWYSGERGLLPDVLARHGADRFNYVGHEVYVSGPAAMMRATLARLAEMQVPDELITFDAWDEPAGLCTGSTNSAGFGPRHERAAITARTADANQDPATRAAGRKVLSSSEAPPSPRLPQHQPLPQRRPLPGHQASKSSSTSSEVGSDWQVSTKPSLFSSGSRA